VQWIVLGGEALSRDWARELANAGSCRVLNHYGPTETTVGVTTFEVTGTSLNDPALAIAGTVPIGRPLANTHAYVLDAHGQQVPVGVHGELYIGGAGVTDGYVNRPELTADRFVTAPAGAHAKSGERLYRTGDRVRYLTNGAIEFLGRTDEQCKIRGYRVELGEVEHALAQHPAVASVVVLARPVGDAAGADAELVAFAVPRAAGYATAHVEAATPDRLTAWAAQQLPEYMVPSVITIVESVPLTANGKIDRKALLSQTSDAPAAEAMVAPRTPTETALAGIWVDVLKKEQVGVTQNFIALGGHSLLAIRVLGRISKQFGVRLPLRTLFDAPTIEELAKLIDAERARSAGAGAEGIVRVSRDAHRIGGTPPASSTLATTEGGRSE